MATGKMRTLVAASAAKWKINSRRSAGLYEEMSVNQENKRGKKENSRREQRFRNGSSMYKKRRS